MRKLKIYKHRLFNKIMIWNNIKEWLNNIKEKIRLPMYKLVRISVQK